MPSEISDALPSYFINIFGRSLLEDPVRKAITNAVKEAFRDESFLREIKTRLESVQEGSQPREMSRTVSTNETVRRQISTKEAANMLGYHPKYFGRKALDWQLTKIYMSPRSCRYYLDEIEALMKERSFSAK